MGKKNRVVAIVVTYNRKELLRECIEALRSQTAQLLDILIIDNASTDGTREYLAGVLEQDERVSYRNTGANLGGAGGFHFGLKEAYRRGYDYMWLMDDDTIPSENALEELALADHELRGHYGFLSSCALWTDGSVCHMNRQVVDQNNYIRDHERIKKGLVRVSQATFVSFFVPRRVVKKLGLPFREYFIWGDDMEYSLRISRRYPCYLVSESKVVHKMKSNTGSDLSIDEKERIDRYELAFRNDCCTAKRNGLVSMVGYCELVANTFFKILTAKSGDKTHRLFVLFRGVAKGLLFHPQVEYVEEP